MVLNYGIIVIKEGLNYGNVITSNYTFLIK